MNATGDPWFAIVVVTLAGAIAAYKRVQDWRTPDEGTIEYVQSLYVRGEIDHAELERRLDVLADPEAKRIRNAVERVSGIGEATSWDVAARYGTLDKVRDASIEELTDVPNIGEKRARALKEQLEPQIE